MNSSSIIRPKFASLHLSNDSSADKVEAISLSSKYKLLGKLGFVPHSEDTDGFVSGGNFSAELRNKLTKGEEKELIKDVNGFFKRVGALCQATVGKVSINQ